MSCVLSRTEYLQQRWKYQPCDPLQEKIQTSVSSSISWIWCYIRLKACQKDTAIFWHIPRIGKEEIKAKSPKKGSLRIKRWRVWGKNSSPSFSERLGNLTPNTPLLMREYNKCGWIFFSFPCECETSSKLAILLQKSPASQDLLCRKQVWTDRCFSSCCCCSVYIYLLLVKSRLREMLCYQDASNGLRKESERIVTAGWHVAPLPTIQLTKPYLISTCPAELRDSPTIGWSDSTGVFRHLLCRWQNPVWFLESHMFSGLQARSKPSVLLPPPKGNNNIQKKKKGGDEIHQWSDSMKSILSLYEENKDLRQTLKNQRISLLIHFSKSLSTPGTLSCSNLGMPSTK